MRFPEELDDYAYVVKSLGSKLARLEGASVLLLGGSGFLGSAFKKFFLYINAYVLSKPCRIVSVDNYIKGTSSITDEVLHESLVTIQHNIVLPMNEMFRKEKFDFIINCSGNASPKQYEKYPHETIDVSIVGTRNVFELAEEHNAKVVNFSSSEVLGTPPDDEIPSNEECIARLQAFNRRAPYDGSKFMIEVLSFLAKERGIDCKVIRPFNVVGYFDKNDYRVIPNYFKKVLAGEKIQVYEPGTQTRTFCFYSDFIIGTLLVLLKGKDILYHIGNSDNEISMINLAHQIADICGYPPETVVLAPTPIVYQTEPKRRCPSIEKAKQELGYCPTINLGRMLQKIRLWCTQTY